LGVGQSEAEWLDEVQAAPGVGAEADHVSGVGRDFRSHQDDMEHLQGSPKNGSFCKISSLADEFRAKSQQ
jgi:hypothetical protein